MREMDRRKFLKTAGAATFAASALMLTSCDGGAPAPGGGSNNSGSGNGGGTSGGGSAENPGSGSETGGGSQTSDKVIWVFREYGDGTACLLDYDKKGKRPSGDIEIPSQSDKGSRVTRIQTSALTGYTGFDSAIPEVTSVTLPGTVEEIGMFAFAQAARMKAITMPGCKKIEERAFYQCPQLETVEFTNSIQSIGLMAFSDCTSLKNITFPKSLTQVKTWAFSNTGVENVVIPGTFEMECGMFEGCKKLKTVIIEPGVTRLNDFEDCTALEEVTLMDTPNKGLEIGKKCFYNCTSLRKIYLPNGVSVYENAFACDDGLLPNLTDIYYGGTKEDWEYRVEHRFQTGNKSLSQPGVTVHYEADGIGGGHL